MKKPPKGDLPKYIETAVREALASKRKECLVWPFWTNNKGYGAIRLKQQLIYVHRFSWTIAYGSIPDGKKVLHRCDNPPCFNPLCLFLGTQLDNVRDSIAKRRFHHGETASNATLTAKQVEEIRKRIAAGKETRKKIGADFGVSRQNINNIAWGRTWRW
jgi:hypothetical protein